MNIENALLQLGPISKSKLAVAAPEDDLVLRAVCDAHQRGLVEPILCGDPNRIEALARLHDLDISSFRMIPARSPGEAAHKAVALAREGQAQLLMKGLLHTAEFFHAVLDKTNGIRGEALLSHVGIVHCPRLGRSLLMTDGAMVSYPDLKAKAALIRNAVSVARGLRISLPKVAVLAAVEVVNPDMPATLDAAALTIMCQRGQIRDCIVDGPLALDLALSPEALKRKKVDSAVGGQADILLFHNIEAANSTLKGFIYSGDCLFGGLLVGAKAPVVVASRGDSHEAKLYSIACAAALTEAARISFFEDNPVDS